MALATNLGYPRIGPDRELKRATEAYWKGGVDAAALGRTAAELRREAREAQRAAGIDLIPSNDFSLYDHVLDTVALVGAVPERYGWHGGTVDLDTYFAMARGAQRAGLDVGAMEMTKWFDTNYHYIVPELDRGTSFQLSASKVFDEFGEARAEGVATRPVLLGPISFLTLSKLRGPEFDPLETSLDSLLEVYGEVVGRLAEAGAAWIQIDEPILVLDVGARELDALERACAALADRKGAAKLLLQTYFGHVGDAYPRLRELPVDGLGLDLVRGARNLEGIRRHGLPEDRWLAAGVVDGRNVWITDLAAALDRLEELADLAGGADRLMVGPSCSLLHVPIDVRQEEALDAELLSWLAFADQKLEEIGALTRGLNEGRDAIADILARNEEALESRRRSTRARNRAVRERLQAFAGGDGFERGGFERRREAQRARLQLPDYLPTTTIGSYPQTSEVRTQRSAFRRGELTRDAYDRFLQERIRDVIRGQEEMGLDVLVHGEFERSDMVEYFAQQLEGYAFTQHGWVQSYGSRYVRPPILFGDVHRPEAMTVHWFRFAQSLTERPVKGMLTGPVTMLQWSFVRDDQPREETCRQLALAVRDEVRDLEAAGARVIQVDEPALREGLPLRRSEWSEYLKWAVGAFRLATGGVRDETQIQTHMCYSEFNDIIDSIAAMDADVLLIENARSDAELLEVFRAFDYRNDIGPGVYDIHSPRVPPADEMADRIRASLRVLDARQLWMNPDCGLKTRSYEECMPALENMVEAARRVRSELAPDV